MVDERPGGRPDPTELEYASSALRLLERYVNNVGRGRSVGGLSRPVCVKPNEKLNSRNELNLHLQGEYVAAGSER